jgi:hypothetical protein
VRLRPQGSRHHELAERRGAFETVRKRGGVARALDDNGVGSGVDGLGKELRVRDRRDGVVGEVSSCVRGLPRGRTASC